MSSGVHYAPAWPKIQCCVNQCPERASSDCVGDYTKLANALLTERPESVVVLSQHGGTRALRWFCCEAHRLHDAEWRAKHGRPGVWTFADNGTERVLTAADLPIMEPTR